MTTLDGRVIVVTGAGGGRARSRQDDVSAPVPLERAVAAIERDLGRIHSVVHNDFSGRTSQKEHRRRARGHPADTDFGTRALGRFGARSMTGQTLIVSGGRYTAR